MHRRQLLIAGGSLLALSACASNGMSMNGADASVGVCAGPNRLMP